jgi:O-antigen biosynthesis protein
MKTLQDLYATHTGKVSDKWALYLREYDRIFSPFRSQAVSLLEIGIQNGGSLEIWSQYFPNAEVFVGCDINPDCAELRYEDPRITVIVGDATAPETHSKVLAQSATFDLIVEDGSHTSSDIVKTFARYFPTLKEGGVFVAEDLHCSYWQEYEGGIFHPYSSITFFKHLSDIVNHEHWGVEKSRAQLLDGFKHLLQVEFDESVLAQISSIEFINSICIVRKKHSNKNTLGIRVIAGETELVVAGHLPIIGTTIPTAIQADNEWSNLSCAPAEIYHDLVRELNVSKNQLAQERMHSAAMKRTVSWRITKPLRWLRRQFPN